MTLNDQQIAAFHESGYLFFAGLLDEQEVRTLKDAVPDVLSREGPEVVREKDDPTAARLAFGAHTYSEPFERLARLPRLMDPVRQLLGDEVYLHQTRMNPQARLRERGVVDLAPGFPVMVQGRRHARAELHHGVGVHRRLHARHLAAPDHSGFAQVGPAGLGTARGREGSRLRSFPYRPVDAAATGRRERHRTADRSGGFGRPDPQQHRPRICGQRLALAAGHLLPDLQRRRQRLHARGQALVPEQPGLHAPGTDRR